MTTDIVENHARPGHHTATVIENRELSRRYYLLVLSRPDDMAEPAPGTFVHLAVPHPNRFYLRRPFSVLDCDDDTLSLIIVEKGEGTQLLRRVDRGIALDLIGPLGTAFPGVPGKRVLALGGGVGLAPLYYYGRRCRPAGYETYRLLYGARSREDLFVDKFNWPEGVVFASDDGSHGFHGNVVQLAERELERAGADVLFSCGPNPMLKAAAELARRADLPHYVSLENRMACALGACRSCVILTRNGEDLRYRTVCNDGPVFDADMIVWEELPKA